MSTDKLDVFIAQIMGISAAPAGMGGASTGILGMTGMAEPTVLQLRKAVMEFAAAHRKNTAGDNTVEQAREIEGLLSTLQTMSVITHEKTDQLIHDLHELAVPDESHEHLV